MANVISKLLQDLHQRDQRKRREIAAEYGTKFAETKSKEPFLIFKGETDEKTKVISFLVENKALKEPDDFYYASLMLLNSGEKEHFILAYELLKNYRGLGGEKSWWVGEGYYKKVKWGLAKKQALKEIKEKIGVDPRELESR